MLPYGVTAMKLLSSKQVCAMISLSRTQRDRLEGNNKFPKRVHPSPRRSAWVDAEVEDWIRARIADRDAGTGS